MQLPSYRYLQMKLFNRFCFCWRFDNDKVFLHICDIKTYKLPAKVEKNVFFTL